MPSYVNGFGWLPDVPSADMEASYQAWMAAGSPGAVLNVAISPIIGNVAVPLPLPVMMTSKAEPASQFLVGVLLNRLEPMSHTASGGVAAAPADQAGGPLMGLFIWILTKFLPRAFKIFGDKVWKGLEKILGVSVVAQMKKWGGAVYALIAALGLEKLIELIAWLLALLFSGDRQRYAVYIRNKLFGTMENAEYLAWRATLRPLMGKQVRAIRMEG
jgi:hypothetical protein